VGPVTACARDEARLGWSPGGGGAAGSDRSGGEKRGDGMAETERKRREKGVVYKGRPLVPGDG